MDCDHICCQFRAFGAHEHFATSAACQACTAVAVRLDAHPGLIDQATDPAAARAVIDRWRISPS